MNPWVIKDGPLLRHLYPDRTKHVGCTSDAQPNQNNGRPKDTTFSVFIPFFIYLFIHDLVWSYPISNIPDRLAIASISYNLCR